MYCYHTHFRTEVLSECQKNPIELLSYRFHHRLWLFNMLTFLKCTEMWLFRHLHKPGIWIGCCQIFLLTERIFFIRSQCVKNGLKILDTNKTDIFELKFSQSDGRIWYNYCREDFSSVCDPLICWLSKVFLKCDSLDSYLTTYFAVYNFRNT